MGGIFPVPGLFATGAESSMAAASSAIVKMFFFTV